MADDKLVYDILVNGKPAERSIKKVDGAQKKLEKTVVKSTGSMISSWVSYGAAIAAVFKTLQRSKALDTLITKMEVATGSSLAAAVAMSKLSATADDLGLDFLTLADNYAKFLASAKESNLTVQESERIFNSVALAGASLKLSNEQIQGTFRALEQMISKGNVQAEELRGQLGERLPGAFNLAAKAMGVTTQQLNKMLERGEVLAEDLLPKLATVLEDKFAESAKKASNSIVASVNRIGNAFTNFSEGVLGLLQSSGALGKFSTFVKGLSTFAKGFRIKFIDPKDLQDVESIQIKVDQLLNTISIHESQAGGAVLGLFSSNAERQKVIDDMKQLVDLLQKRKEALKVAGAKTPTDATIKVKLDTTKFKEELAKVRKILLDQLALKQLTPEEFLLSLEQVDAWAKSMQALLKKGLSIEEASAKLTQDFEDMTDSAKIMATQVGDFFESTFADRLADSLADGKTSFTDFTNSILRDIARIAMRQAATAPLGGAISTAIGSFFGSAKGNAFNGGAPTKHAKGGVPQGRNLTFPMANGGVGSMNERSAEGIFPLARTATGDLGVKAVGGSGDGPSNITVEIINQSQQTYRLPIPRYREVLPT